MFWAATLQCSPQFLDWSQFGPVHIYGEEIVPGGRYAVQAVDNFCKLNNELSFSAPRSVTTSRFGDLVGTCTVQPCSPADHSVDIVTDVLAVLDKFANRAGAVIKVRAEKLDFVLPPKDGVHLKNRFRRALLGDEAIL